MATMSRRGEGQWHARAGHKDLVMLKHHTHLKAEDLARG